MMRKMAMALALAASLHGVPAWAGTAAVWQMAAVPESTTPINKYSREEFELWWSWLDEAEAALDAKQNWAQIQAKLAKAADHAGRKDKLRHYSQHSAFEPAKERLRGLIARMYALQIEQVAGAMPETVAKAKASGNPAQFDHLVKQAEGLEKTLAHYTASRGGGDAEIPRLTALVAAARKQAEAGANQTKMAAAAKVTLPAEAYAGSDKSKLRQMVLAKWKSVRPDDQVLGVRFYEANWRRKREASLNNGSVYYYDNSILQGYVVTRNNAELACIYPIYVRKDNSSGKITIDAETQNPTDILLRNVRF